MNVQSRTLILRWVRQGTTTWSPWWTDNYGRTKTRVPTLFDHINFANYDLGQRGLGRIENRGRHLMITIREEDPSEVNEILEHHGFRVVDGGWGDNEGRQSTNG